ncbi:hypothetical protein HYR53_03175 [Candidatus Acetothermia bacterium]|nr:hypothetical protein [Candidatus Acetothermia bacterium]
MAKFELQRSGLLSVNLDSDKEDYRGHLREAIGLLKNDDERFLYIAKQIDSLVQALVHTQQIKGDDILHHLGKIADYSRLMAGQPSRYRKINSSQHTEL